MKKEEMTLEPMEWKTEEEIPEGAEVINMGNGMPEAQKPKTVKEVLAEDVMFLRGMNFTTDEVEKFGLVIAKVKQDLIACVDALEKAEKEGKKDGNADAE